MNVASLAVKNPPLTILGSLMLVALGVLAFRGIPRSEDPHFPLPFYTVLAVDPGATALGLEQSVAEPVEDAIRELDGVKTVTTDIRDGASMTQIEFDAGVDPDATYQELAREVERIRPKLPSSLRVFEVERARTTDTHVLQLAIAGAERPYETLSELANDLASRIEKVSGVREAEVWGAPERQVQVELDSARLAQLGIPEAQVLGALRGDNESIPGGTVEVGRRRFDVTTSARFRTLDDVSRTVVAAGPGGIVHLAEVAEVRWGYAAQEHVARWNGEKAVFVTVRLKDGQNIFDVRDEVMATVDRFERGVPSGVTLARGFDQSRNVASRLGHLYQDFGIALLLVLVTLLPLGLRASGLVMLSVPISMATGLILLHAFGFGLNQLSIVGFVIALGLVVDDSIVVVENITRFLREGRSRTEAAIEATRQIGVAVIGCTATLVLAFVPLLLLPGRAGDYIRSLPMAVIAAVAGSLVVSLTLVPYAASRLLPRGEQAEGNVFLKALHRAIERSYSRVLRRAVASPKTTLALAAALFAASLGLLPLVGKSLFPEAGIPQLRVTVDAPTGATLEETDRAVRFAESVLRRHPEVVGVFSNTGRGNPQIYYNVFQHPPDEQFGELFVQLAAYDPRRTPALIDGLRHELGAYERADIRVRPFANGPPIEAPIALRVYADDLDELARLASRVESVLRETPGTRDVTNPIRRRRTDLRVEIDRDRAGALGVPTTNAVRSVRLGLAGLSIGSLREDDGDSYDIRVRAPNPERPSPDALSRIYVSSLTGAQVPLSQIATVPFETSPNVVQRRNGERMVTVSADVIGSGHAEAVTRAVRDRIGSIELPAGARIEIAGEAESRAESFDGLGGAVVFAVFAILAVLVLEFKTLRSTLVVATVIPLGVLGGIAALFAFGYSLSFTAAIGFIALVGIEIKSSILLVDLTNQLRREGASLDDALRRAGEVRFLPIVLTTATALGGLVPLALEGSPLYSPLALVIIGGLVTSTLLARLVTPAAYKLLAN